MRYNNNRDVAEELFSGRILDESLQFCRLLLNLFSRDLYLDRE